MDLLGHATLGHAEALVDGAKAAESVLLQRTGGRTGGRLRQIPQHPRGTTDTKRHEA